MAARKTITVCAFALALAAGAPAEAQQAALPPSALVGFGAVTGGCGKWASAPEGSGGLTRLGPPGPPSSSPSAPAPCQARHGLVYSRFCR